MCVCVRACVRACVCVCVNSKPFNLSNIVLSKRVYVQLLFNYVVLCLLVIWFHFRNFIFGLTESCPSKKTNFDASVWEPDPLPDPVISPDTS